MPIRLIITLIFSLLTSHGTAAQPAAPGTATGGFSSCASRTFNGAIPGALAASSGLIFAGAENGSIHAFSSPDLEIKWRAELGGEFASELLSTADGVMSILNASDSDGSSQNASRVLFVSSHSGVTIWTARLPYSTKYHLGRANGAVAAVSQEGAISLIDPSNGHVIRQFNAKGLVTTRPAFADTGILFGTTDGKIHLSTAKGAEFTFDHDSEYKPTSVGFLKNEGFAVGDERGYLAKYGPQDGKAIWKFKGGAAISSVTATEEGILGTSLDNFVYLLSDYNGNVVWRRRLTGRVLDGGLLLRSSLVSLVYGGNNVYHLDIEKGKVLDAVGYTDADLVSRVAVRTGENSFVLATTEGLRTYSMGTCIEK